MKIGLIYLVTILVYLISILFSIANGAEAPTPAQNDRADANRDFSSWSSLVVDGEVAPGDTVRNYCRGDGALLKNGSVLMRDHSRAERSSVDLFVRSSSLTLPRDNFFKCLFAERFEERRMGSPASSHA